MTGATTTRMSGPPAGIVDVWCVRLDAPEFPHDLLVSTLDSGEQGHAARLRLDGRAWASAHGARRAILASYLGIPAAALQFFDSESGKPRLADVPGLEFSFARTDCLAVVAIASDRAVGVDVERENDGTDIDLVTREFLPLLEVAALQRTPPDRRRSAFFKAWARYEARLKLHGHGLSDCASECGRAAGEPEIVRGLALRPGFAAAVAAEGNGWTVRVRDFLQEASRDQMVVGVP